VIRPSEIMQIRFVGATIGRPLHLPEFQTKTPSNLWFNHNSGGRTQFAPTKCMENSLFLIIKFLLSNLHCIFSIIH